MTQKNAAPDHTAFAVVTPRTAAGVKFFRIRDLDKFQHYKDRNPPWVKLYVSMLFDDFNFQQLPVADRYVAVCLIALASKLDNRIPNDPAWVAARIMVPTPVDFDALLSIGFLDPILPRASEAPGADGPEQMELPAAAGEGTPEATSVSGDASKVLASCYQAASPETQTETEAETQTQTDTAPAGAGRSCVCCGKASFSEFSFEEAFAHVQRMKAAGVLVGGRPIQNPGGLARTLHREGTADAEIREYKRRESAPPAKRREFAEEACTTCLGSKWETVPGKGARPCESCVNEQGRPTGKRPKEG